VGVVAGILTITLFTLKPERGLAIAIVAVLVALAMVTTALWVRYFLRRS
jgi:hypothetical protein